MIRREDITDKTSSRVDYMKSRTYNMKSRECKITPRKLTEGTEIDCTSQQGDGRSRLPNVSDKITGTDD